MKLILLKTIPKLGGPGDVVDVKPGYANNYLLKYDRAIKATEESLKKVEEIRLEQAKIEAENKAQGEALAEVLNEMTIEIPVKAGLEGRLFGSVTSEDIAKALEEKDIHLDKRRILLKQPIRTLGTNQVRIRTFPEVEATLTVDVVQE